jgi:hypothetical protein
MSELKRFSLVKPSLDTPFHIDFAWWKHHDNDWRVHLYNCLCADHQKIYENMIDFADIDWVDPNTAEVHPVDGLQNILMTHCAKQAEFLTNYTTVVDAVFRVLLANGNTPLTPREIEARTGKPAETILRLFTGAQSFKGIRPYNIPA